MKWKYKCYKNEAIKIIKTFIDENKIQKIFSHYIGRRAYRKTITKIAELLIKNSSRLYMENSKLMFNPNDFEEKFIKKANKLIKKSLKNCIEIDFEFEKYEKAAFNFAKVIEERCDNIDVLLAEASEVKTEIIEYMICNNKLFTIENEQIIITSESDRTRIENELFGLIFPPEGE